jgi:predicted dehydrogenase
VWKDLEWEGHFSTGAWFVEKPMGNFPNDGNVMVGFSYRWDGALARFVESLRTYRVFSLSIVAGQDLRYWHEGDYRMRYHGTPGPGGIINDSLPHSLYVARWILGDLEHVGSVTGKLSGLELQTEDTAMALFRSKTGVPCHVLVDYLRRPRTFRIEAVTTAGVLIWEFDPVSADAMYRQQMEVFCEVAAGKRRYGFPDWHDGKAVEALLDKVRGNPAGRAVIKDGSGTPLEIRSSSGYIVWKSGLSKDLDDNVLRCGPTGEMAT